MIKRLAILFLLLLIVASSLFSAPTRFVFGDLGQHPEILGGFLPSYLLAGVGVRPFTLLENNISEIQFLLGFGYNQRKLWQDKDTGAVIDRDPLVYDSITTDWVVRLSQGIGDSTVKGKDLLTFSLAYEGKWEINKDSMVKGKNRINNIKLPIKSLDNMIGTYNGSIYPDLQGDRVSLSNAIVASIRFDLMDDRKTTTDGFLAKFDIKLSPASINNGKYDYSSVTINFIGAKTIYQYSEKGSDIFTIVLIDRLNVNTTTGDKIPVFAQGPVSLGRRVRGFNTWTYNTATSVVNNFDIRFSGPAIGVNGIFPRANLFFDVGYGNGEYFNTNIEGDNRLMSTGIQLTVSFFDFIDLGYQVSYLFDGVKFTAGPNVSTVGSFTFFLDF